MLWKVPVERVRVPAARPWRAGVSGRLGSLTVITKRHGGTSGWGPMVPAPRAAASRECPEDPETELPAWPPGKLESCWVQVQDNRRP